MSNVQSEYPSGPSHWSVFCKKNHSQLCCPLSYVAYQDASQRFTLSIPVIKGPRAANQLATQDDTDADLIQVVNPYLIDFHV
jgi:invasion protein IalB